MIKFEARISMVPRVLLMIILIPPTSSALTIYRVGPGRPYASLQQVTSLLNPGDTVLVDGDTTYLGGVQFTRSGSIANPIVIIGAPINNNRPRINGGANTVHFHANHYVFEGFEITGGASRCIYHQGNNITIRHTVVHDCPAQGILGADRGSGSLLLEHSEVYNAGNGTQQHPIYMATDEIDFPGSVFRMQFCYIHGGLGGNLVKSRSERNEIYYNWLEGGFFRELELIGPDPAGGVPSTQAREHSDVVGNVFWKTSTATTVRVGGDGTGSSNGRYRFVNNTFVLAPGSGGVIQTFDSLESVELHNNVFYRQGGGSVTVITNQGAVWTSGAPVIAGQNNWVPTNSTTPTQWSGTLTGTNPGFIDITTGNVRLSDTSALRNAGTSTPMPVPGFEFLLPLFPPAYHPPLHTLGPADQRLIVGQIDISAFEALSTQGVSNLPVEIPGNFSLLQNYPNPFNPTTKIEYALPKASHVTMRVYNMLGQQVATVVSEDRPAGRYTVDWNAYDNSSGVYLYRLQAGDFTVTRKMLLLR